MDAGRAPPPLPRGAADLSGTGRRDLVTVSTDEGGYRFRLFHWRDSAYVEIPVPAAYALRLVGSTSTASLAAIRSTSATPSACECVSDVRGRSSLVCSAEGAGPPRFGAHLN